MVNRPTARIAAALTLLALGGVTACSTGSPSPEASADTPRLDVVAGFYPLQFVSEKVGGDAVTVTGLAKPGAEPHDMELNASQVGQVTEAELVVYLSGFQPAVDEAVTQNAKDRAFDRTAEIYRIAGAADKFIRK